MVWVALGVVAVVSFSLGWAWRSPERDRRMYMAGVAVGRSIERQKERDL